MRLIALLLMLSIGPLAAQTVQLVSHDGELTLEGALLGFDGEHYRIDTIYGPLTVDSRTVICKGVDCPVAGGHVPTIRISGNQLAATAVMPVLIEGFARANDATMSQETARPSRSVFILRKKGQLWARFEVDATNTREAYADLVSEGADIALVTAAPTTAEAQMAQSAGSGDLLTGERSILLGFDRGDRAKIEPDFDMSCGIKPDDGDFDVQAGESQSAATISLYTPARRLPKTGRDFLKFAASRRARDVIDEAGLRVPAIVERPFFELGDRLAYAVSRIGTGYALEDVQRVTENLTGKTRLSSTFRFMAGGARALDMRSRGEIGRLSDEISDGDFNGRVITLAGFSSDDPRGFARSKSDAERVLRELRSHADYPDLEFAIQPFGNVFPVLCDRSDRAAHLNRRVEIWVD